MDNKPKIENVRLSDIRPDDKNANKHTERGTYMLRRSMEKFGFLEAGVLDAHNRIVGGNLRTETAADVLSAEDALVIDVDGRRPVFVRRRDIDLDTPEGREAGVALNRSAQVSIEFDAFVLDDMAEWGEVNLDDWFLPGEREELAAAAAMSEISDATDVNQRRMLGDSKKQIKAVLYADELATFERAMLATGNKNRADALMEICEYFLEKSEKGQLDAALQSFS